MVPEEGLSAPETREMSVDLPAPFSPNSTCTSPRLRSKSTSMNASTPGKRLEMFFRTRISPAPEDDASGAAEIASAIGVMIGVAAPSVDREHRLVIGGCQ